jgi:hypothetical protein
VARLGLNHQRVNQATRQLKRPPACPTPPRRVELLGIQRRKSGMRPSHRSAAHRTPARRRCACQPTREMPAEDRHADTWRIVAGCRIASTLRWRGP